MNTGPPTQSGIDLRQVVENPYVAQVARLLDTYYSGVNAHDPQRAASVFAHDGNIDPANANAVAQFGENIRTSHDDHIVVHSIRAVTVDGRAGLKAVVTFRSRQAAALGPSGNDACADWDLVYTMRYTPDGSRLKLLSTKGSYVDC